LTVGSTGADVTALQTKLGVSATGYFGALTKAAVVAYQTANGIVPATGYVGPLTLAKLNYVAVTTTTTTTTTTNTNTTPSTGGDEGELNTFSNLTGTDSSVEEGQEDVKVFGAKFDAEDSDMTITRVDVEMTVGNGGSSQLDNYITEAALMVDGDKVATMDVDEADEDDDIYTFRFKGLNAKVSEDATAKVYVLVSAVGNIDSNDEDVNISVDVQADGIRAVDEAGISDTYASNTSFNAKSFSVSQEDTADVSITEASSNPDASILVAKEDDESSEYEVFAFNIESQDADSEVKEIVVDVVSASSSVDKLINEAILVVDGKEFEGVIDSTTASSTKFTFDINGDVAIDADDDMDFVVKVVLNSQTGNFSTSGETLTFSVDGIDQDVEDLATGDNVAISENVDGATHSVALVGVSVSTTKSSTVVSSDDANGDYVTHKFTLSVKSLEDTIYVPLTATTTGSTLGFNFDTLGSTWTGSTTVNVVQTSDLDEVSSSVKIVKGQTATIEVSVTFNPTVDGYYGLELDTVRFSETAGQNDLTYTAPDTSAFQTSNSFVTAL
jgi:peptidoglycan hydrolase-like protein with peptidoglycan-binding domain